jgi:hypothetical protein
VAKGYVKSIEDQETGQGIEIQSLSLSRGHQCLQVNRTEIPTALKPDQLGGQP